MIPILILGIGILFILGIASPLLLLVKNAIEMPDMIELTTFSQGNEFFVIFTYKGDVELTDVNLTVILLDDGNNTLDTKSIILDELNGEKNITIIFPKEENFRKLDLIFSGKIESLYKFKIVYSSGGD